MKTLITICARGGSKGIPGKNIKILDGYPLIYYTIRLAEQFRKSNSGVDIIISTDSEEIKKVGSNYGIESEYLRPPYLAEDTSGKIDAIKDVLLWKENYEKYRYNYIIDMDVTSPLRNIHDLMDAMRMIREDEHAVNLFSVSPARRSPYFNMVERKKNGYYSLVKPTDQTVKTRQSSPEVFEMNASFYIYRRTFFELDYQGAVTDKSLVYTVPHICFDLDHSIDFEIISFLIKYNKLDFEL